MIDESMDKEQMAQPPQPWEFRSKPAWQRLIIMLGGVTVNFLLAIFIYIGMSYFYGDRILPNENIKDGVLVESTVANKAGLLTGDKIISVDGEPIEDFSQISEKVLFGKKHHHRKGWTTVHGYIARGFFSTANRFQRKEIYRPKDAFCYC